MTQPVFRFAPSPNGDLHLGHAYPALLNTAWREVGGRALLLRIEDIDTARCTPEFEAGIYRDLSWLGIGWENPVRRQSEHFSEYGRLLERLIAEELVYPAFMSRGEIARPYRRGRREGADMAARSRWRAALSRPGQGAVARERKRRMTDGTPFAWRLDMAAARRRRDR